MLQPTGTRVLIKVSVPETTSPGGIILPAALEKNVLRGQVLEVGSEVKKVSSAQQVVYSDPLLAIKIDGEDCVVVEEASVLLVDL
jgi:co-chaperonin GroES (HSP10)